MDYKEEKNEPTSIEAKCYEENCNCNEEEDDGLSGLFIALENGYRINHIHTNILTGFSNLFANQMHFEPSFQYLHISKILYDILEKGGSYEYIRPTFHCIYGLLNQKDPRYSAELLSFPLEKTMKTYIDKGNYIEESFMVMKKIVLISEYHMIDCMKIIPTSELFHFIETFSSSEKNINQVFSYISAILTYNVTEDFISDVLQMIKHALLTQPFEGIFEICATLMKKEQFDEMQHSIELCKTINNNLEKIPQKCLPIAFAMIGDPQTTLDFEPNLEFIVYSMNCNEQSAFAIRSSAMFCMSNLLDKDHNLANIAFDLDIVSVLLNTDEQNSFENNEKFILISKLIMHSSSTLHYDILNSDVFQILIDMLESSEYNIFIQAIICIVNTVLNEKGVDEVLELQEKYDILDIIEKSITKGNELTQEMASNIIKQIPHE